MHLLVFLNERISIRVNMLLSRPPRKYATFLVFLLDLITDVKLIGSSILDSESYFIELLFT